jgi:prepilin-type N-terminal cleavage/methylation domain-containing protein
MMVDLRRHSRAAAFTLIEVLIALTLVAIVAATLASTLRLAYHAARTAEADIEPSRSASIALEMVSSDVQNALPGGGTYAQNFEGTQAQDDRGHEADDLVFYSTAESPEHAAANGEIKKVEITVEKLQDGSDYVLVRRALRNLGSELTPAPDEEVLCRGVSSFTLTYFDGSSWNTTWDSTTEDNTVPAAVRVVLELNRPATPGGPARVVRYTRIISIPCSNAPFDSAVNSGVSNL